MIDATPIHLEYLAVLAPLAVLFVVFCISARLDYVRESRNEVRRVLIRNKKTLMSDRS